MQTDLVVDPLGAHLPDIVAVARVAEETGYGGVWTFDHFSGAVAGRPWSRDPFVILGAVAAVTDRVDLGVLVANMMNRHPVQLASAVASLQSLAPGRVWCGLGSGADPSSRFAVEHHAIGTSIPGAADRRARLVETIHVLREVWASAGPDGPGATFEGEHVAVEGATGVVGPEPSPPIVVGTSGLATIRLAARYADGVNIRRGPRLAEQIATARAARDERGGSSAPFEVSVFESFDADLPLGGEVDTLAMLGVTRRTLVVSAPYPVGDIVRVGRELRREG